MTKSPDPVPIETLLRYRGWLRSLIRELVSDPDLADDVEQATWAVAIQRPPRHRRGLGAWLARVAASRVNDNYRREQRRHHREAAVVRTGPTPSTEEQVSRAELQRRVASAVLALKEPYRTAVLQRYFAERSPAEIADMTGVPIETARTHIKRGKAKLRMILDEEFGGQRKPWALAGLPLLRDCVPGEVAHTTATGALMMSTKKVALCALVALLLLGAGWLAWEMQEIGSNGQQRETPAGLTAAGGERTDDVPRLVGSGSAGGREGEVQPTTHARRSHGVVRDATYRPLAGVSIRARSYSGLLGQFDWQQAESATDEVLVSDARGRFASSLGSSEHPWTLVFIAQGDSILFAPKIMQVPPGAPEPDVSVLVAILDRVVVGRVFDAVSGAAIQDARVFLWGFPRGGETRTGPDGSYSLRVPGSGRLVTVGAVASGHAVGRQTATVTTISGEPLDFRLHAEIVVSGHVTREGGEPVPDAVVRSSALPSRLAVRSDSAGRYVLRGVGAKAEGATIMTAHSTHGSVFVALRMKDLPDSARSIVRDIVLPPGVGLQGTVIGPGDEPISHARVTMGRTESSWNVRDTWTGAGGHFRFGAAEIGPAHLIARAHGYAPAILSTSIDFSSGTLPPLRMTKGQVLEGRVTDDRGTALANIHVGANPPGRLRMFLGDTFTDSAGRFQFSRLPAGRIRLSVGGRGFERQRDVLAASGQRDVHVVLRRAAVIAGRVIDDASGDPVRAFRVRIVGGAYHSPHLLSGLAYRSADGVWDSGPLMRWPGNQGRADTVLVVSAGGYAPQLVVVRRGSPASELTVRLVTGSTVHGTVRDPDGKPIANAKIWITWNHAAGLPEDRPMRDQPEFPGVVTDEKGKFLFTHLPRGSILLHASADGYRSAALEVRESQQSEHDLVLYRGGRLEGRVLDSGGKPRAGVYLHLGSKGRDVGVWRSKTATDGSFAFSGLDAGTYLISLIEVRYRMPSYWRTTVRVELGDGATSEVSFAGNGSARVRGRITGTEHLPPEAVVVLEPIDTPAGVLPRWDRAPHTNGVFEFEGLPPGRYRLRINHSDWRTKCHFVGVQEIRVQEGGVLDVQVGVTGTQR